MAGTQVRASTDRLPIPMGENHKLAWASAAVGQCTGGRGYFLLTFFAEPLVFWTAVEESATGAAGSIIFSESRRLRIVDKITSRFLDHEEGVIASVAKQS